MSQRVSLLEDVIKPLPKQLALIHTAELKRIVLYGGARGPGKSYILRWILIWYCIRFASMGLKRPVAGLFTSTYDELRERQIAPLEREAPRWLGQVANRQSHGLGFYINPQYGGGVVLLRNLDDPAKRRGGEMIAACVDEANLVPKLFSFLLELLGSLRWSGTNLPPMVEKPRLILAANPGGVSHVPLRDVFMKGKFQGELEEFGKTFGHELAYVKALPSDNPHLPESYWAGLRGQPKAIQEAWINANWDVLAGTYFDDWVEDLHVQPENPPEWWVVEGGMDWGYSPDPGVITLGGFGPQGQCRWYKEITFYKTSPADVGQLLVAALETEQERAATIRGDTQMWIQNPSTGVSIAEEINNALFEAGYTATLVQANKDRVNGWARMAQFLDTRRLGPDGLPWMTFTPACENSISTIPTLVRDDKNPLDIKDGQPDHWGDSCRYGVMGRPALPDIPLSLQPTASHEERVAQHTRQVMKRIVEKQRQMEEYGIEELHPGETLDERLQELWADTWT